MKENYLYKYDPYTYTHPSLTIWDLFCERYHDLNEFAIDMDLTPSQAIRLLSGYIDVDETLANKLYKIFGVSVEFWLNRQKGFNDRTETDD